MWDDRDIVDWATAGGRCLSREEADRVLAEDPEAEETTVTASSDGNVTGGFVLPWRVAKGSEHGRRWTRNREALLEGGVSPHTSCHPGCPATLPAHGQLKLSQV